MIETLDDNAIPVSFARWMEVNNLNPISEKHKNLLHKSYTRYAVTYHNSSLTAQAIMRKKYDN